MPGVNFRATSGYVSDGSGETYSLGEVYPTTRGGLTFGFDVSMAASARDRSSSVDRRLAGVNAPASPRTFRLNLPNGAGTYRVRVAVGDQAYDGTANLVIKDGTGTTKATISGFADVARWRNINNVVRTEAQFVSEYAATYLETAFSESFLTVEFQTATATQFAHISVEYVAPSSTPIAFTGTVPTINFTIGTADSVDLSTYFSGTETPFTYALDGASSALPSGVTLSSAGLLEWSGSGSAGTTTGVIVQGADQTPDTADTNSFSIVIAAPAENPVITGQPSSATVKRGQTATFTTSATGSGTVTYQWQRNPGGVGSWADISGATSASYTTPATTISGGSANDQDDYRCNVSDDDAGPVATDVVTLTVQQATLALNAAGYEIADGNSPATAAIDASVAWEIEVINDALPPVSVYHSDSVTTSAAGRLADISDDDLIYGTTYTVLGRRLSDGEWFAFTITAT